MKRIIQAIFVGAPLALLASVPAAYADPIFKINGLATETNPQRQVSSLITILLGIAFSLTVIGIIVGGFVYLTSAGNEDRAERGKEIVTNSIIGLVVIILAFVIVQSINLLFTSD